VQLSKTVFLNFAEEELNKFSVSCYQVEIKIVV
jgi:hypothetical protein